MPALSAGHKMLPKLEGLTMADVKKEFARYRPLPLGGKGSKLCVVYFVDEAEIFFRREKDALRGIVLHDDLRALTADIFKDLSGHAAVEQRDGDGAAQRARNVCHSTFLQSFFIFSICKDSENVKKNIS